MLWIIPRLQSCHNWYCYGTYFQNGAFDSGVYRPQRRVFVMDEEGNFVQSTASIANANGKPTGGIQPVSSYKWDINPNGANTAPTLEQVRSHFKNLPTDFDMTSEKFQNNIYESNLTKMSLQTMLTMRMCQVQTDGVY